MNAKPLDPRSRTILLETINDYVTTAEPVGSRTLAKKLSERWSSATIRNVMADLEEMGFLYQPHVSAGRIPTDLGYRYFVNELLQLHSLANDKNTILGNNASEFKDDESLAAFLGAACTQLSKDANQTSLVMVPTFSNLPLKHIEFVQVNNKQILAVFVSQIGIIQNRIIESQEDYSAEKLASISKYLSSEFTGQSLESIRKELVERMKNEREHYSQLMKKAAELWEKATVKSEGEDKLLIEGLNLLLSPPELASNLDKMKALFKTVEEKDKLIKLLDLCTQKNGMSIVIGQENSEEEMQGCSLIAQNYQVGDHTMGTLAVFGPKRMDYLKMISLVNSTANNISEYLSKKSH